MLYDGKPNEKRKTKHNNKKDIFMSFTKMDDGMNENIICIYIYDQKARLGRNWMFG